MFKVQCSNQKEPLRFGKSRNVEVDVITTELVKVKT
jgi:hypothetical protein